MIVNKALYYALINPNKLRCYVKIVWDNIFDPNWDICLDTCERDTVDFILNRMNIGFSSHVPTEEELMTFFHIKVTSGSE